MIKFQATALIHSISPVINVTDKFQKRELILNDSYDRDGNHYSSFVIVEFTGDRMAQLDYYAPGQRVTVEGIINGREYNNRIYNTVKGQTIAPYQQQAQYAAPGPAQMPGAYPQQQPYRQSSNAQTAPMPGGYPQQPSAPAYPQQPQQPQYASAPTPTQPSAPASATPVQQSYGQHQSPGVADLPFPH